MPPAPLPSRDPRPRKRAAARIRRGAALASVVAGAVLALFLVAAGAPASTPPYRDHVLADAPIGYWRLGETTGTSAADETGYLTGVGGTQKVGDGCAAKGWRRSWRPVVSPPF